eukprot:9476823-Pyramimonas_sp.AAC.2
MAQEPAGDMRNRYHAGRAHALDFHKKAQRFDGPAILFMVLPFVVELASAPCRLVASSVLSLTGQWTSRAPW